MNHIFMSAAVLALASSPATATAQSLGQVAFQNNCAICHTVDASLSARTGPGLHGVLGRRAASVPGFSYSDALARAGAAGKAWTRSELDAFLRDPVAAVPGTTMAVSVADPAQRAALIDYLATLAGAAPTPASVAGASADSAGAWTANVPGKTHHLKPGALPQPYATPSVGNNPKLAPRPDSVLPSVPAGFKASVYAVDPDKGRLPLRAPNGDIFMAQTRKGQVAVLRSSGGETADTVSVFATGLQRPYGMAFYPAGPNPKYLYVATINSVLRFPYQAGDLTARGEPEVVVAQLSETTGGHTTRNLVFSADGKAMLVSIGSATNVAADIGKAPPEPLAQWEKRHGMGAAWGVETDRATVTAFDPDGRNRRTYATGLRNCVGLLVYPGSGDVMCSVNERDELGDDLPPDYVTRVKQGGFYGWPWYYIGGNEDPRLAGIRPDLKTKSIVPDVLLQAHSAPLGMAVYHAPRGAKHAFPKEYEGDIFVALHGSWNRGIRTGYKVVRVMMKNGVPTGQYQDFMTGMVLSDREAWGRPSGVEVAADGALLVVDDAGGVVWRVAPVR
ncbi:MAG TPA: PQQ-dependent sugar dehydrogenase [Telluria sp.]|nr:PQQ-dependent sugar dehydrogenase [Telluria sp.]